MWKTIALGLAALGLAGTAQAQEPAELEICELHVFGAQRDFSSNKRLAGPFALRGTWQADPEEPLAAINLLSAVQRADTISDDRLRKLLPEADEVRIIRHSEFAEIGKAKRTKSALAERTLDCHAELYALEFYNIGKPTRHPGAIASALMAPDGWHATYIFRRFDARGKIAFREKESMVAPLAIANKNWLELHYSEVLGALAEATNASFDIFLERLAKR